MLIPIVTYNTSRSKQNIKARRFNCFLFFFRVHFEISIYAIYVVSYAAMHKLS